MNHFLYVSLRLQFVKTIVTCYVGENFKMLPNYKIMYSFRDVSNDPFLHKLKQLMTPSVTLRMEF